MIGWLKRQYGRLPVARELNDLRETGWQGQGLALRQTVMAQERFLADLLAGPRYADPRHLARSEFRVFSQHGEDGIIAEIFRRVGVGGRTFVEIGVGNGLENNTANLLRQGWRGAWVEADAASAAQIRAKLGPLLRSGALSLAELFVSRENIWPELRKAGVETGVDLLSLDVDQNTYWVWDGLRELRPRVAVVEYNPTFPPGDVWKVAYQPDRVWDETAAYGASLSALEELGRNLGYALVGCDLSGNNAFFVRDDLAGERFLGPFDAQTHYEPARHFLTAVGGYPRGYEMFFGG